MGEIKVTRSAKEATTNDEFGKKYYEINIIR